MIGFAANPNPLGACHGKGRYNTEGKAREWACKDLRKRSEPTRMFPYACTICRRWHLTRKPTGLVGITRNERWEGVAQ